MPDRKKVTLKESLRWAYSIQMVHLRDHTQEGDGGRWIYSGDASCLAKLNMVGQGTIAARSLDFHPDAETIHDAVMTLSPVYAQLVMEFGRTGQHPEPCQPIAMPQPFLPNVGNEFEREGQGIWRGEHRRFRVTADETTLYRRPIYRSAGRGKVKIVAEEEVREPNWYCPITWWPDPVWCEAVNGIAQHWTNALARLWERLAPGVLREREIVGPEFGVR